MINCQNLKKRFKLEITGFTKYPDELRWNLQIRAFDLHHPVFPPDRVIHNFAVDYDGDIVEFKFEVKKELKQICNENSDQALIDLKEVIDKYTGV